MEEEQIEIKDIPDLVDGPGPRMIEEKSWAEFRETGLFLFINQILHVFGWALVAVVDDDDHSIVKKVFPARCKFRGFDIKSVGESYLKMNRWMAEKGAELLKEAEEE